MRLLNHERAIKLNFLAKGQFGIVNIVLGNTKGVGVAGFYDSSCVFTHSNYYYIYTFHY